MLGKRSRPPVLAEVAAHRDGQRAGAFTRFQLEAFAQALAAVGDARTVLVTGDEGKGALALGLATAAAVAGRSAALIECDLAMPTLAERLGLAAAPGLREHLEGEAEPARLLQPVMLAGPAAEQAVAPLVCVVAGSATREGPALLSSERFPRAIAGLGENYDPVVLDGPPLDAEYSLATIAPRADTTLACLARPPGARRLTVPIRGVVLNRQGG